MSAGSITRRMVLASALSMSIGWGIRGNFGHQEGAMLAGVLAALAAVIMAGRADWRQRIGYFAALGGIGWSFGGAISYMWVIGYTHSGQLASQIYGFACLFVIGFTWAALGGIGTALPACLDRERLTAFFAPLSAVLVAWFVQGVVLSYFPEAGGGARRHESILYWYDTSWLAALSAPAAVLLLAVVRRRLCWGTSFVLCLAAGWWAGFLLMVLMVDGFGIDFRMTPPRGDNWAGALGMTAAAFVYLLRHRLRAALYAGLVAGLWGGIGFATATFLKLVEIKYVPLALSHVFGAGAWQTNWHSVLEQTYGLFNGAGIAFAMSALARRLPPVADEPRRRPWTEAAAVAFVLVGVTYVNLIKLVSTWVQQHAVPPALYGLPARVWFQLAYGAIAVAVVVLLIRHLRRRLAVVPENALGRAQLLYLVFLWWVVVGNWMRAIPPFADQRLITEGVIHLNAVVCTMLILLMPAPPRAPDASRTEFSGGLLIGTALTVLVALAATTALETFGTRRIHGDRFVGYAGYHVRFGAKAPTGKPVKGQDHP